MMTRRFSVAALAMLVACGGVLRAEDLKPLPAGVSRVPVVFSGGHETVGEDRGRPIILIAAALGVSSEVFREAFSRVRPADPRVGPSGDEARKNKQALMSALGKHGITNDRLDEVSNYYRYRRGDGELWTHTEAKANALVKDGKVVGYEITEPGAGYSSVPSVSVPGVKQAGEPKVEIAYGKDLETNGRVSGISVGGR